MTLTAENKRPDLDGVPTWENNGNSFMFDEIPNELISSVFLILLYIYRYMWQFGYVGF